MVGRESIDGLMFHLLIKSPKKGILFSPWTLRIADNGNSSFALTQFIMSLEILDQIVSREYATVTKPCFLRDMLCNMSTFPLSFL